MQLSIMNKVKSGELSIEDALTQARRNRDQLLTQKSLAEEVTPWALKTVYGLIKSQITVCIVKFPLQSLFDQF